MRFAFIFAVILVLCLVASSQSSSPQNPPSESMPGMTMDKSSPAAAPPKPSPAKPATQQQPAPQTPSTPQDMAGMKMGNREGEKSDSAIEHAHISSGTAWQPLSTPMHMLAKNFGDWLIMAHGNLFLTYNQQGGRRGVGKLESTNWAMVMEQRALGRGTIQFRQMLSGEPLTAPHGGFPQLFQTGETYKNIPLVDHQHPHDVFGELTALYSLPISERVSWMVYGGPSGEPAIGPVAYLHRWSASELGAAPLGHHLQDSTHISYGVITSGFVFDAGANRALKLEGSAFNGREPDEDRVDMDFAPLDSFSGRATFDPSGNWSAQYSYAHLVHPEAAEPGNINRQTASVEYNRPLPKIAGNWNSTLLWGRNHKVVLNRNLNSYLLESVLNFKSRNYAFTRMELVDKDELFANRPAPPPGLPNNFRIAAFTFGGVRDVVHNAKSQIGLGADVTFYSKPDILNPIYGSSPVSFRVFVRLRPGEGHMMH